MDWKIATKFDIDLAILFQGALSSSSRYYCTISDLDSMCIVYAFISFCKIDRDILTGPNKNWVTTYKQPV